MASSSTVFGDLFAGKSGQQTQALALHDFTIARTSSALQPVGDTDVEMVTPEKRIVTAPAWLSYIVMAEAQPITRPPRALIEHQAPVPTPRLQQPCYHRHRVAVPTNA